MLLLTEWYKKRTWKPYKKLCPGTLCRKVLSLFSGLTRWREFDPRSFYWKLWWTKWYWVRHSSECVDFPLSLSFYEFPFLISMYSMWFLPEEQMGGVWEPSIQQRSFGHREALNINTGSLFRFSEGWLNMTAPPTTDEVEMFLLFRCCIITCNHSVTLVCSKITYKEIN
jgi:hypothetical protein